MQAGRADGRREDQAEIKEEEERKGRERKVLSVPAQDLFCSSSRVSDYFSGDFISIPQPKTELS